MILTALIESEFMLLGRSKSGIDALMPEALGNCCSTRVAIFDETSFSAAIALPQMKSAVTAIAMRTVDFHNIIAISLDAYTN